MFDSKCLQNFISVLACPDIHIIQEMIQGLWWVLSLVHHWSTCNFKNDTSDRQGQAV